MLNGIVFGTIRWVMGNAYFNPDFISHFLQVFFEDIITRTVAAAPITQDQDGSGLGIFKSAFIVPPVSETIAGKLSGILTGTQIDVACISFEVINGVRNDDPFGKIGKIDKKGESDYGGLPKR